MTVQENNVLKEEVTLLKTNLEMFTLGKREKELLGKKNSPEDLLKTPIFFEICKFLPIPDILNLQMLNKPIYFGIKLESKFVSTINKIQKQKYSKEISKLETKLSYFLF